MDKKKKKPNSPLTLILHLLLAFHLPLTLTLAAESDRITSTSPLSGDQTILSSDGTFRLGFYQPVANSNRFYIATWYNKISQKTPVWIANRDSPVPDKRSFSFTISSHGHLVLTNSSTTTTTTTIPVWSTNSTTPFWPTDSVPSTPPSSESVEAVLLNNGNLVLRLKTNHTTTTSTSTSYYWQSFDHPAHTWLPGSKFGLNKRTGKTQLLTSWKDLTDPSTGLYSLTLDPNGTSQYLILWNLTRSYWSSGVWDDNHKIFTLVPEMRLNYIYNFSYVDTANESYFVYSVYDPTYVSRFVIDVSGQIKQYTWLSASGEWNLFWSQPRQQCEVYAFCGGNGVCDENGLPFCKCVEGFRPVDGGGWGLRDYSSGCVRNTPLFRSGNTTTGGCGRGGNTTSTANNTTNNDGEDRFWVYNNVDLPDNPVTVTSGATTADECKSFCLNNCSCTAYSYSNGCSIWLGDLLDLKQNSDDSTGGGETLYLRLAASEFPTTRSHKKTAAAVVVGASVGGAVLAAVVILTIVVCCRRKARRASGSGGMAGVGGGKTVEGTLVAFSYKELQVATKNFSEKLGGGGFGSVFKGTLRAGGGGEELSVAVKKLESISQGEKQFRTEVSTIGTIQHVNLVRLRGFCSEGGDKKLLVYDFMPNGSLDAHLFLTTASGSGSTTTTTKPVLDWKTRYQIALGTARGLTYLHEKCRDCIIHCDIKPENILLDKDYCPKVADFGLAKLVGRDFSRVLTTMRGTRGYLAPEWISGVAITAKADVYSYGMMLFELVSGRRNTDQSEDGKVVFFPTWAATKVVAAAAGGAAAPAGDESSGNGEVGILSIVDARLEGVADGEEVMRMCKLGCWCIQDDENRRPSMGQVVQILEGVLEVNTPPMPRSLQVFADNILHGYNNNNNNNILFFTESSESSSSSAASKAKTGTPDLNTSTTSSSTVSETRRSGVQSGVSNGSVGAD